MSRTFRNQSGFTLIELLAVMAIIAVLAAIIAPAVSGTKEASVDAAAFSDAQRVRDASAEFFKDQNAAEVLSTHTVTTAAMLPTTNGTTTPSHATTTATQFVSSRWPEKFITTASSTAFAALYQEVVTTSASTNQAKVRNVSILDKEGKSVAGQGFLEDFTAIDVQKLQDLDLLQGDPQGSGVESESGLDSYKVPNFLWLFERASSGGESSSENDSREVAVYKLLKVQKVEPSAGQVATQVDLTYQRIF